MREEPTSSECCRRVQDPQASDESTHAVQNDQQQRDRLNENWTSWKSRQEHREVLTELRDRDGLSNVEGGCVLNNNSEKQRRHLRKIPCFEDIAATVDSGATCCVFPRDFCNDVPIRQGAESRRGMMFRIASGQ